MTITLRSARTTDADFVNNLTRAVMSDYVSTTWPSFEDQETYFKKNTFDLSSTRIIQNNDFNGTQDVGRISTLLKDGYYWIDNIHVLPETQSLGIGSFVLKQTLEEARAHGCNARLMLLKTNPVKDLYLRLGFFIYDETQTHYFMEFDTQAEIIKEKVARTG